MQRYVIILITLFISTFTISAQDTIASQVLNQVNLARQEAGIAPLYFNTALQSSAQQHSDDMASVDRLSHTGTNGSLFYERIQSNGYRLSAGAENVLSREDTHQESVFWQWYNSEPHRVNLLNADYDEVGIAYARAESGRFYFTMVLGTRNDFVTPTAIPTDTPVPTQTTAPPTVVASPTNQIAPTTVPATQPVPTATAIPATTIPTATRVSVPAILTHTPIAVVSESTPPDIQLVYDNNSFVLINVSGHVLNLANLFFESDSGTMSAYRWNTEFLSQPLSGFSNGDCLQAWTLDVSYLNTPDDCRFRHAWIAVADDVVFWRGADIFTVRDGDSLVGLCRIDAGLCEVNLGTTIEDITVVNPEIFGNLPDLRLEYPDSSFTLINVSGRPLDLSGLVFRSDSGILAIEQWDNGYLSQPLSAFGDGGCLQAWTFDYPEQSAPERCRIRHAWILVGDTADFWRQVDVFTIEKDGITIGRCDGNETYCSIFVSPGSSPNP